MRDVISGIAARIHPAGSSFVLAPPQHMEGQGAGLLPPAAAAQQGLQAEAGRPGTLISSGSQPQRVRRLSPRLNRWPGRGRT